MKRKSTSRVHDVKLLLISLLIGLLSALLASSLKRLTEFFQHLIFNQVSSFHAAFFILLPSIGITTIYFVRKYFFLNRKNKGITEIYKTLDLRKEHLPFFKISSHYLNGFFTVIFGGSTGIEVSTVVASATIGNTAYKREFSARMYKRELICAGVAAGVAVLFASPLTGWLFALEIIARKFNKTLFISCTAAALVAAVYIFLVGAPPLLNLSVVNWEWSALPYFLIVAVMATLLSVYFTFLVTRMKPLFARISNNFLRVNTGAVAVGLLILAFPVLYGDSYHGLKNILSAAQSNQSLSLLFVLSIALLKPLAASLTLGAGGDGGVFAPSIIAGGFLGLFIALICNAYFGTHFTPLNFALIGIAAMLSAVLHAPLMALVLTCELLPNGYVLFFPILMVSLLSLFLMKKLLPYNVYNYDLYINRKLTPPTCQI